MLAESLTSVYFIHSKATDLVLGIAQHLGLRPLPLEVGMFRCLSSLADAPEDDWAWWGAVRDH